VHDLESVRKEVYKYVLSLVAHWARSKMLLLATIMLFLPGLSWILCSGMSRRFGALEKIALSVIISIIFDSLFTAVLALVTSNYVVDSTIGTLTISFVLLSIWALCNRRSIKSFIPHFRFDRMTLPLATTVTVYGVILLFLGWSTPIYPGTDAADPVIHAQFVEVIIKGSGKELLTQTSTPIGLHFASALLAYLLDFNGLTAMRILLAVSLIDFIVLTYFCARTLLGETGASFTTLVAGFVIPVSAMHFIQIGTFPNMLSDTIVLAALWLTFEYVKQPNRAVGLTLSFLAVGGLFVHSTFLLFLVSLWIAFPAFMIHFRVYVGNYLKALLFTSGGLLSLTILLGSFLFADVQRVLFGSYGVGSAAPTTPLTLGLQVIVWNYVTFAGPVAPLLIAASVIFVLLKRRNSIGIIFVCIWLGVLIIAMFLSTESWRFILLSMVPGSFLIGDLLSALSRLSGEISQNGNIFRPLKVIPPLLLLILIMSGSFIPLFHRIYSPTERSIQLEVFSSMSWLQQNDKNYSVASVSLSLSYRYLQPLTGISYLGDYAENAHSIIARSANMGFRYVAVAIQSPQFPTFEFSSSVQEKYQNSIVAIFFIES